MSDGDDFDTLASRLSHTEWNELVAGLPDDVLAHLVIATVRQLRRRLARSRGRDGKSRGASVLERSARQLIAELGGQGESDNDW